MPLFFCSLSNLHCLSLVCCRLTEKGKKDLAEEHTRSLLAHLFRVVGGVGEFVDGSLWQRVSFFQRLNCYRHTRRSEKEEFEKVVTLSTQEAVKSIQFTSLRLTNYGKGK
ncbi:hypothetical protein LguiB_036113 [Lonicera macranthoides]